ncbi:MAG: RDD family protein [Planctomycetes bacterium]|nr:RDD family protein [Planctomycetota bacterium]
MNTTASTPRLAIGVAGNPRTVRTLVTPEGVPLPIELAAVGDRMLAFLVDSAVILAGIVLLAVGAVFLPGNAVVAVALLGLFALTFVYFPWCELRWQGRTLGKKVASLRVIDRAGGRLTARAIVVRNLTREVEIVLPFAVLSSQGDLLKDAPAWIGVASFAWIVVLGAVPLLNKDRQRIGDLLAGTVVIHSPRAVLLSDLSEEATRERPDATAAAAEFTFTAAQLAYYGEYELEVLADLLRSDRPDKEQALDVVRERVQIKIGWPRSQRDVDPQRFLLAFYAAQRAHLEQRLLFGKRKTSKSG